MKSPAWSLALLLLFASLMAGCSQQPVKTTENVVTYLEEAKPVSVQTAQTTAIRELLGGGIRPQGKVYTKTFTTVDIYDAPFTHITVTSPKKIGKIWQFAKKLKGDEWPKNKASSWGIAITGATEARTPVSQTEYGLETLQDIYETVKAMGGPGKFERIVAPLSTIFWLEHKDGSLWSTYTHEKISDEEYEQAKKMYDEILSGIDISESDELMTTAWAATPTLSATSVSADDGSYNLADFATLGTQATYQYSGSWTNPEARRGTLMGQGGFAQQTKYYARRGERWRVGACVGGYTTTDVIGCGPAAFSAMLAYHFKEKGEEVNGFKLGDPARYVTSPGIPFLGIPPRTVKAGDGKYETFLHFVTGPVGSQGVPRIVDYMGSCYFNGVATSGGAFSNGGKAFLENHAPDLSLAYSWSRGFSNPGSVGSKVDRLRYANNAKRPAVVLYPSRTFSFHFSFVQSWEARRRDYGLFVVPENTPNIRINMGDTFSGEVGVWSIY